MADPNELPRMASCPFCADRAPELTQHPTSGRHYVACTAGDKCNARGPSEMDEADAIDAWNQTVPRDGPDSFEHWTCGTGHIRAKRTLQIVEAVRACDNEAIETIAALVDEAGPAAARDALINEVPF